MLMHRIFIVLLLISTPRTQWATSTCSPTVTIAKWYKPLSTCTEPLVSFNYYIKASIRESYSRPLPKVRSSKANVEESAQRSLTPGTLSIEHIHQIILLHQGKFNGQQGPMATKEIAERFHVDTFVIEKIVQSISLPQEEDNNNKSEE